MEELQFDSCIDKIETLLADYLSLSEILPEANYTSDEETTQSNSNANNVINNTNIELDSKTTQEGRRKYHNHCHDRRMKGDSLEAGLS